MLMRSHAISYDQLHVSELACLELCLRRAQLVELRHRDRVVSFSTVASVEDDDFLYLGTGRTRGQLMVCPSLEEFVAGELHKEAQAANERRKLVEARSHGGGRGGGKK